MISRQLELWGVSSKSCCSLGGESEDLKIQDVEALELWNCEAKTFFSSVCGAESNTTNAGNGTNCTRDVGYIIDPNDPKCKTHCLVSVGSQVPFVQSSYAKQSTTYCISPTKKICF